ncbi:MAG: HAD family hydrolase [Dehalococcoidia bacterium]
MRPFLVALDVDGTIVHRADSVPWHVENDELPSDRVRRAVRAIEAAGIAVVLASGRMYPGTQRIHEHLELATHLICQQGAAVHEPTGEVLHEFPLDLEVAREVVALANRLDHPYEWFTPLRYLASRQNEPSDVYAMLSGVAVEYHTRPEDVVDLPTGAGIISNHEEARGIHAELAGRLGEAAHVIDFPGVTVCVAPEATKGHALAMLAADLGVEQRHVVAIGDSVNDAPMLGWAGRGYAPSHSDAYAIDAADEVLDMSRDDAVAELLERIARGEDV